MPTLLVGECLGVKTETVTRGGKTWDEKNIVLLDGYTTHFATVVRDFAGVLPEAGEVVALRVGVRAYPKKTGGSGYAFTAFGRIPSVEKVAADFAAPSAAAAAS